MKLKIKKILMLFFVLQTIFSFSQVQNKLKKVVNLIEPQSFYLNGGSRSLVGGNSRIGFVINLPLNTVEWYYAFTTEQNKNSEQNIKLDNQLTNFILQVSGVPTNLLSLIQIPEGNGIIDIFLTDRKGYDNFFEKDMFGLWKYKSPSHNIQGSRTNIKEGKVKIEDLINGSHFLVIRNTSSTTGINIKLEVVAIVEEIITDNSIWEKNNKDLLYNNFKKEIKKMFPSYNESKIEDLSTCFTIKFTTNYKPEELKNLAEFELKAKIKEFLNDCDN